MAKIDYSGLFGGGNRYENSPDYKAAYEEGKVLGQFAANKDRREELASSDSHKTTEVNNKINLGNFGLNVNKDRREEDYLKIAQADLGIRLSDLSIRQQKAGNEDEAFGWVREDRKKAQETLAGMSQAAQSGGFGNVIEYLKTVDPDRAIKFQAEKLKLDDQILNNQTLQETAAFNKTKMLYETYGLGAKMSSSIMSVPEADRPALYQQMKPFLSQLIGADNVPENFDEKAKAIGMLMIAQGTPDAVMFAADKNIVKMQSKAGKIGQDLDMAMANGWDNPANSNYQKYTLVKEAAAKNNMELENVKQDNFNMKQKQISEMTNQEQRKQVATEQLNKSIQTDSKTFRDSLDTYAVAYASIQDLKTNPSNTYAQGIMMRALVKQFNSGAMTDADVRDFVAAAGIPNLRKQIANAFDGNGGLQIRLTSAEFQQLSHTWEVTMGARVAKQQSLEARYTNSAKEYNNVLPDALRFPSYDFYAIKKKYESEKQQKQGGAPHGDSGQTTTAPPQALDMLQNNPALLPQFIKKYGYDPTSKSNGGQ